MMTPMVVEISVAMIRIPRLMIMMMIMMMRSGQGHRVGDGR